MGKSIWPLKYSKREKKSDYIKNWWKFGKSMKLFKYKYQIKSIRFEYLRMKKKSLISRDENTKNENRYEGNFTTLSPLWDK